MSIEKTVNRYLTQPEYVRSCQFKRKLTKDEAAALAQERGIKSYHCRFGKHWHVGNSRHLARLREPRVLCPHGCGRQIRTKRLDYHLNKCRYMKGGI